MFCAMVSARFSQVPTVGGSTSSSSSFSHSSSGSGVTGSGVTGSGVTGSGLTGSGLTGDGAVYSLTFQPLFHELQPQQGVESIWQLPFLT